MSLWLMVERLLFHALKNLPRRDSFLKHSMVSDYLPEFKSNQNHNTFMMQLCESGQRKEIKLTDTSCRVMFSRQKRLQCSGAWVYALWDSFREIYGGVMGKLPGWRRVAPCNGLCDPGLVKVSVIRSN